MHKVLISLPEGLVARMKTLIPQRQRSKVITKILEKEIKRREEKLYKIACEVEKDDALYKEMKNWDIASGDGIEPESW